MNEFTQLINLASAKLGAKILNANDEFFAPKENLLKPELATFIPHKFTSRGKWMDGWETRRRRIPGYDWCIVRLGLPGIVHGVEVDTSHFTGNYPEYCSLDACYSPGDKLSSLTRWVEILPKSPLQGNTQNRFTITHSQPWTHLRLNIYPDGGVARLRVYGEVLVDWNRKKNKLVDLVAIQNGGVVLECSDMHFGSKDNLLMPGRAKNMGEGWETRRRRGPGYDWAILKLGTPGFIQKIEVDTNHFKGNYPESCSLEGCFQEDATLEELKNSSSWEEILPRTKLKPNKRHFLQKEIQLKKPFTHVRLSIFPDGGVSRLRLYGKATNSKF
ncbi:MAG: allantoicase [Elusimicrobia bacterium]|nr:allantoicase [Elusimicrobiota bacterium]